MTVDGMGFLRKRGRKKTEDGTLGGSPGQTGEVKEGNGPTGGPHQLPRHLRDGAEA